MPEDNVESQVPAKPPGAYRLLHTADWHLGKMLGEHSREEEHRRFLDFLLKEICRHSVDLLLIAGDVFDSANPPQSAVAQYYNFLSALYRESDCSVIVVAGNHDSPAHLEAPREVLKALRAHVVGALPNSPAKFLVPMPSPRSPQVVVAALPFLRDRDLRLGQSGQSAVEIQHELVQGIRKRYAEAAEACGSSVGNGVSLVATGHLMVSGSSKSSSEREIHVGGLGAVGVECFPEQFTYVALGHLHRPQSAGGCASMRYSGSPIPLSFSEAKDHKELRVLDVVGGKLVQNGALAIPLSRPLAQICCDRQSLEERLAAFEPPESELPAWVEVVIENPPPGENLYELVQRLAESREFEVIRVLGNRSAALTGLRMGGMAALDGRAHLLDDPAQVFAHRLKETTLTEAECAGLTTAFAELRSLHAEHQREGALAQRASRRAPMLGL